MPDEMPQSLLYFLKYENTLTYSQVYIYTLNFLKCWWTLSVSFVWTRCQKKSS